MARVTTEQEEREDWRVERLVEAIENGAFESIEELSVEEVRLLATCTDPGQSPRELFELLTCSIDPDHDG